MVTKQDVWALQETCNGLREQLTAANERAERAEQKASASAEDAAHARQAASRSDQAAAQAQRALSEAEETIAALRSRKAKPIPVRDDSALLAAIAGKDALIAAEREKTQTHKDSAEKARQAARTAERRLSDVTAERDGLRATAAGLTEKARQAAQAVKAAAKPKPAPKVDRTEIKELRAELAAAAKEITALRRKAGRLEAIRPPKARVVTVCEREPDDIAEIDRLKRELAECQSAQPAG